VITIIEGMDNCGKTTLIDSLLKGCTNERRLVVHCSSPPANVNAGWSKNHYNKTMRTIVDLSDRGYDIFMDRSYIGECVYGPLYRKADITWVSELEQHLGMNSPKVALATILCTEFHAAKYNDGNNLSDENWSTEHALFTSAFEKSIISNKIKVNLNGNFDDVEFVKKFLGEIYAAH